MKTHEEESHLKPPQQERRRWIKVDIDDDLFAKLHVMAAESRMRFQPYLRRCLSDASPYPLPRKPHLGDAA